MWHVVHIRYHGQHRGYELWHENRPCLTLKHDAWLKRNEAYRLCRLLNFGKA